MVSYECPIGMKNHHVYTCIHHRTQLAVGDMTMSGLKSTIGRIPPPPPNWDESSKRIPEAILAKFNQMQNEIKDLSIPKEKPNCSAEEIKSLTS